MGLHAGLLGPGLTAGLDLSRKFTLRAQVQRFDLDETWDDDYAADISLSSIGLLADWHPTGGSFRLTLGVVSNDNEFAALASDHDLEIGIHRYDAELNARISFDQLGPYLGLGWSTRRNRRGLGVTFDLGVLQHGEPALSVAGEVRTTIDGASLRCRVSVVEDGMATVTGSSSCTTLLDLRDDLMLEHDDLTDELSDFELYPVVALGLIYRF